MHVARAPITTETVVVLVAQPHIHSTLISKSFYLLSFSMVLTEVLVLSGIVMSMRRQVLSFLLFSTVSCLLAAMPSVWMGMSHRMVTLILLGDSLGFMLIPSSSSSSSSLLLLLLFPFHGHLSGCLSLYSQHHQAKQFVICDILV